MVAIYDLRFGLSFEADQHVVSMLVGRMDGASVGFISLYEGSYSYSSCE